MKNRVEALLAGSSDIDRYDDAGFRVWTDDCGFLVRCVHSADDCAGRPCAIHRPSDHHMKLWPRRFRPDKVMIERICPHGVGHPDPDDMAYQISIGYEHKGVHGCDGCCHHLHD